MKAETEVKEILWPGKTFAIAKAVVDLDKVSSFFNRAYTAIYASIKNLGLKTDGLPCAIIYSTKSERDEADLAAAVPVLGPIQQINGFQEVVIPKSKALLISYFGEYEKIGSAYEILESYLSSHKMKKNCVIEEYIPDPPLAAEPGKWKTNIYCILSDNEVQQLHQWLPKPGSAH